MTPAVRRGVGAALAGFALAAPAGADSLGDNDAPRFMPAEDAAAFSKQIERTLADNGARVALVFRSGRRREDLPDGVGYTHGAFWVHQAFQTETGQTVAGYGVYNLYSGEDGDGLVSYLHQDFPIDFVISSAIHDVAVLIPTPELQKRLFQVMASETYQALHRPDYSLLSHPHDRQFQNCNEFMLDVMGAAIWDTDDIDRIKANLSAYFEPTKLKLGFFKTRLAPFVDERARREDQSGRFRTVTQQSLQAFMAEYSLLQTALTVTYSGAPEPSG
ncbi:MAG: DUF2145 domain-containing protein [Maricaulaceae bacterium]